MPRTLEDILARLIAWFSSLTDKITDFSIGSVIRAIFEAVALELEELYTYLDSEFKKTIQEAAYTIFRFSRAEAIPARAGLVFYLNPNHPGITIPKGFTVATRDGLEFSTVTETYVPPRTETVEVEAVCTIPGFVGNVPANTITRLVSTNPYIISVTNPFASSGGINEESESDRKKRFASYVKSLRRGTKEAILYGLSTIRDISYAKVVEDLPGIINIYVTTHSGNVPDTLLETVQNVVNEWVAAGIQTMVYPIGTIKLDVQVDASLLPGYDEEEYRGLIETAVVNYLGSMEVGEDFIPENLAGMVVSLNPKAIRSVSITPSTRVTVGDSQVIRPGKVTVTITRELEY